MIPPQAVEAAANELHYDWDAMPEDARRHARIRISDALEAAAPHMLAACWSDAYEKGRERGEWEAAPVTEEPHHKNPYSGSSS